MEVEVSKQTVDQMLVNSAAQPLVNPNVKVEKDAETPDFDSMVHQKRAAIEKGETESPNPTRAEAKEKAEGEAVRARTPATDEQYVIAAAMMFQAQPDMRYTAIQAEAAGAAMPEPRLAGEAARPVNAEAIAELPTGVEAAAESPNAKSGLREISAELSEMTAEYPKMRMELPKETAQLPEVLPEQPGEEIRLPELSVELSAQPLGESVPAEFAAETTGIVTQAEETPDMTDARPTAETPRHREVSPQARHEIPAAEARPKAPETERPAEQPSEQPAERTPRVAQAETPRAGKAVETPPVARSDERTETAEDDTGTKTAQTQQETLLFEQVEAPPVKVAEVPRPIPLEAENGIEQLGGELDSIVVNSVDANRIEVTLTPENLGKLTVEITRGEDGTLNVVLHATTEKAANLLEKGADGLRQALAANAGREAQIEVRGNEGSQQQFLNPDGRNGQERQQQQQQGRRQNEQRSAQDFLQQLRLGLVDVDENNE